MQITPYGAAGEVTGSAYVVETDQARVLVDFGMFQGGKMAEARNRVPTGLRPRRLDAVLLTHCHLDHVGRLPLLVRRGFRQPIFATEATLELTELILRDAAKIQAHDNERLNRKRQRQGLPPVAPLFESADVDAVMSCTRPVTYDEPIEVAPGMRARFAEAGHILGSASIQLLIQHDGREAVVVFSGDLGPPNVPILRDYECLHRGDLVFLESTYGDHDHRPLRDTIDEFEEIVSRAVSEKGKILVPTFAVGRAQLMLWLLADMFRHRKVPSFPVFLDSPMAIEATRIYQRHPELFDDETLGLRRDHQITGDLPNLTCTVTPDESKAINDVPGPCLILAGAGMCNAGRILHHFKQNLWRPETWVLIVGYQSHGTLGRRLVDAENMVRIHGEKIAVKANIRTLGGFSAHAGQRDLLAWLDCLAPVRPRVVLTHGEPPARDALAAAIRQRHGLNPEMTELGRPIRLD